MNPETARRVLALCDAGAKELLAKADRGYGLADVEWQALATITSVAVDARKIAAALPKEGPQ